MANIKKRTPSEKYEEKKQEKKIAAQVKAAEFTDSLKESRAIMAENYNDSGRAERIRNRKKVQGVGEVGESYKKGGKIKVPKKKYEKGGSVETKPKYSSKEEWAKSSDAVEYVAKAMESRGIGFDSSRTQSQYRSLSPQAQKQIADEAFSRAAQESRQRGSTNTRSGSYKYNTRFKKGGMIKVNKKKC